MQIALSSMNKSGNYAETLYQIKRRYEDASLNIFRERDSQSKPIGYFSSKEGNRSFSYTCQGNTAAVVQRVGNNIVKTDEKAIASQICIIM
ncbi:uncharacterized protein TNCV_4166031 [Trichonephila clavipes]|uniref:Uncharacterized protein n=2 Tax=Trichonephila TaxID=2585208 RepID=A0A8X6I0F7_TRICU|nr:uncharacterized protein TNCT_271551 [Trichonephila clavata]GFX09024.1 uncharacterized protein TNCV_4166031 [Trichonephila clavipes]GFY44393.1 uncharacterized protein TNIN_108701 [Trichonephila inaurata madagascariensis]